MTAMGSYWMISLTVIASLLLSVNPIDPPYNWLRPEWTAMVVLYWTVYLPERVGVVFAWLTGLLLDGFTGVTLGQNALSLSILAYICHGLYQRMRNFAIAQQAAMVFVLVGLHLLVGYWVESLTSNPARHLYFLAAALSSALVWPLFAVLMRYVYRSFLR